MYTDKYNFKGDHPSVADELFSEVSELELKYDAVYDALEENYYSLPEALTKFGITEIEFLSLLILNNRQMFLNINKQDQLFKTISYVISIFQSSNNSFDTNSKKAILDIEKIAKKSSGVHLSLESFIK